MNFTTTDKASLSHGVKMLVYGHSGVGKTRLCATAPAPLIISAEAGLLSLRQYSIPVVEIHSLQDLIQAYQWCHSAKEARQYQTLCIDSVSEVCEKILVAEKQAVKDGRMAYGNMIERAIDLIKCFRDLSGFHVYVTSKVEVRDGREQIMIPGSKLGFMLPYLFDEVFRMGQDKTDKGEAYSYLQTTGNWQFTAKDRSGALDPVERPDLNFIINKILGK